MHANVGLPFLNRKRLQKLCSEGFLLMQTSLLGMFEINLRVGLFIAAHRARRGIVMLRCFIRGFTGKGCLGFRV